MGSAPTSPRSPAAYSARVRELFDAAADRPASDRPAYLDEACGGDDADVRTAVERLLAADADDTWFESPAAVATAGDGGPPAFVGGYRVIRTIGRGGSGVVYEAEQASPRRRVAVKVLRAAVPTSAQAARLAREADILGRLSHPNIAKVHEAGVAADGRPFFAMELFAADRTLAAHAAPLPVDRRVELVADVCDAVDHAHACGIVHLDLKPANILVDPAGRPKVLDFGIARLAAADPAGTGIDAVRGLPIGTLAYMSPEQLAGRPDVDGRADVYALGVVLGELLAAGTGRVPWRHRRDLRAAVARATAADPAGRYPTAAALAVDLRRCLSGHPLATRRSTAGYRGRRFVRRHRALTAGAAATSTAAVAAVAVALAVRADAHRRVADAYRREADDYRRAAERNLYVADVRLARESVNAGQIDGVRRLLADAVGDRPPAASPFRGWEWDFLDRLTRPPADVTGSPDRGEVRAVAVSARAHLVAAAGYDHVVRLYALPTDKAGGAAGGRPSATTRPTERFALRGHVREVFAVAFSPAGDRVASAGWDGRIRLWDTTTGAPLPLARADGPAPVVGLAFGPDGRWFAAAVHPNRAVIYETATGRARFDRAIVGDWVTAIDVSRDGRRLAALCGDGTITVWTLDDGFPDDPAGPTPPVVCPGGHGWASDLALSPDGRQVAAVGLDGSVSVFDAVTGDPRPSIVHAHDGCALSVEWSPDGTRLATGGRDGLIHTWDADDGAPCQTFAGHGDWVFALAYAPGGRLVSGGKDGTTRFWRTARPGDGSEAIRTPMPAQGAAVAYHPDGHHLVVAGSDGVVRVCDDDPDDTGTATGAPRELPGRMDRGAAVAVSPDGRWVAAGGYDGTVHLWPWPSLTTATVAPRVIAAHHDWVRSVAFSPDSSTVASSSRDRTVRLWAVSTGQAVRTIDAARPSLGVAFSPDGRRLAWGTELRSAYLLDLADGRRTRLVGHTQGVNAVAFAPDGRTLATAGDDLTVRLWDATTGEPRAVLRGHANVVSAVAFSPDGRRLASAGDDRVARLWDPSTGRELVYARGPAGPVWGVAFSPDGRRLAAVGDDPAVFVWTAGRP